MTFDLGRLEYNAANQNPVLDYIISVEKLPARYVVKYSKMCTDAFPSENVYEYAGSNQRFSITGFRVVLKRHYSKYL